MRENPILVHELRCGRRWPSRAPWIWLAGGMLLAILLRWAFSVLPSGVYLDELAIWLGLPAFFVTSLVQSISLRRGYIEMMICELSLTRTALPEVALGLHVKTVMRPLILFGSAGLLVPFLSPDVVGHSWTGHMVFAFSFIWILEWTSRLVFLIWAAQGGARVLPGAILAGFVGSLMIYGVAGFLRIAPDDWVLTPVIIAVAAGLFFLVSVSTLLPFLDLTGECLAARVLRQQEDEG